MLLGQAHLLLVQNLKFACDQTGRMQRDLKSTDTFTVPRLSWDLKPAAVPVFQLLGFGVKGVAVHAARGMLYSYSSAAALLLLLSSLLCQGSTMATSARGSC